MKNKGPIISGWPLKIFRSTTAMLYTSVWKWQKPTKKYHIAKLQSILPKDFHNQCDWKDFLLCRKHSLLSRTSRPSTSLLLSVLCAVLLYLLYGHQNSPSKTFKNFSFCLKEAQSCSSLRVQNVHSHSCWPSYQNNTIKINTTILFFQNGNFHHNGFERYENHNIVYLKCNTNNTLVKLRFKLFKTPEVHFW